MSNRTRVRGASHLMWRAPLRQRVNRGIATPHEMYPVLLGVM
jgi:hypothetical protein